jgi:hypothetical protein
MQGLRQSQFGEAAIESLPSTEYEPVHLDTFEASSSLTEQYTQCDRDLKRCITQTQQALLTSGRVPRFKLEPIEKRLLEHKLRLDIWSTDCGVAEGYLEHIGSLSQPISDILRRSHSNLQTAAEHINKFCHDLESFVESFGYEWIFLQSQIIE